MKDSEKPFYQRLTQLFRSGPSLRRKVTGQDTKAYYDKSVVQTNLGYYGGNGYKRESSPFSVLGSYGLIDRITRYSEFVEMQYQPEINTALDVYADETTSGDEKGNCFHVFSNNRDIQRILEELFYGTMNIEGDLRRWVRNLITYGDFFLYLEVQPDVGVFHVEPIMVSNVERQQFFDPEDPYAVRFKLVQSNKILENWQVAHFRIINNDLMMPYGTSLLEPVRRTWRVLSMLEDAMLLYRIVRSAERRVFYIDTSGVHPNDVGTYMETVIESMKGKDVIDKMSGRVDLRYNPMTVLDDYYIPVKKDDKTKIDTLPGGQHVSAVEDVEYMQKKLIAGLKVPKAYLTYTEDLSSKAGLAMEDVRFSRTITALQRIVISELNKIAILHLYAKGFEGEDLVDFELRLSNPSTIAIQQKLQTWSTKFDIASKAKESGLVDEEWIQEELLGLRQEEILKIRKGKEQDKLRELTLDKMALPKELGPQNSPFLSPFDAASQQTALNANGINPPQTPPNQVAQNDLPVRPNSPTREILKVNTSLSKAPVRASMTPSVTGLKRASRPGADATGGVGRIDKMIDANNRYTKDIADMEFLKSPLLEAKLMEEFDMKFPMGLPGDIRSILECFDKKTTTDRTKFIIEVAEKDANPSSDIIFEDLFKDATENPNDE